MPAKMKGYTVIFSAPDGLERERQIFRQTLVSFNETEALERGAFFTAEGWAAPLRNTSDGAAKVRDKIPGAHYFIMVLWDRWVPTEGNLAEARRAEETEQAYRLALASLRDQASPMRQIVIFFKALDDRRIADAGPMMKSLLAFRRTLDAGELVAAQVFDDLADFETAVRRYLSTWTSNHEKGITSKAAPAARRSLQQSPGPQFAPSVGVHGAQQRPAEAGAAELLRQGRITDAETILASEAAGADDFVALNEYGTFLAGQGRLVQAETVFERLVELAKQSCDEIWEAISLNNLAEICRRRGRPGQAEAGFQTALALREKLEGPEQIEVGRILQNLAELHRSQGRYRLAEPLCKRVLVLRERSLGQDHPETLGAIVALAELHHSQGNFAQAEALYERMLEVSEKSPATDESLVALCLNDLALLYDDQGEYLKAMPFYHQSLEIRERTLGKDHPDVAASLNNLAALLRNRDRVDEAEELQLRSLDIWERTLGPEHPDFATGLGNLADLCSRRKKYDEAEQLHRRVLRIRERTLGAEHPDIATSLHNLAGVYRAQARHEEAAPLLRRTITIWEKTLGANHPNVATSAGKLADTYRAQGNAGDAEESYRRAIAIMERNFGTGHPELPEIMSHYATLLRETHRPLEAERMEGKAQGIRAKQAGKISSSMSDGKRGPT